MSTPENRAIQQQKRFTAFAAAVTTLTFGFPKTMQGRHVAEQLFRSATAAAANYGEALGAESRADFIHKLRIVLKEVNETEVWLELTQQPKLSRETQNLVALLAENRELCRMTAASIRTAGGFESNRKSRIANRK